LDFLASTSLALTQIVKQGSTTTVLSSAPNPSSFGSNVVLTAVVSVKSGSGMPSGVVTFWDGATSIGSAFLINGTATMPTASLAVGSHALTAVYNGDANFTGSTSAVLAQAVLQNAPLATGTTIMFATPNPSEHSEKVTFFASVVSTSAVGIPTGTVEFYDGATLLGTAPLLNGLAIFSTGVLTAGTHSITAKYVGSSSFSTSTAQVYQQVVKEPLAKAKITLYAHENPAKYGTQVLFRAMVHSKKKQPTGSVTFFSGSHCLGMSLLVDGKATVKCSSLSLGKHHITAVYSGDSHHRLATSQPLIEEIVAILPHYRE
jgi:hypothetical protein